MTNLLTCRVIADGAELDVPLRVAGVGRDGRQRLLAEHPVAHRDPIEVFPPYPGFRGTVAVDVVEPC